MLTSMTGYGRSTVSSKYGKFIIELQSLNRKFLESFVVLPKEFMRFEVEIKKWIYEKVRRGQVTARVVLSSESKEVGDLLPNEQWLMKLSQSWKQIAEKLKIDQSEVNLQFLAEQSRTLISSSDMKHEQEIRKVLKKGFTEALAEMVKMKEKEGSILAQDMQKRLKFISNKLRHIEKEAPQAAERFKQRILLKVKDFFSQPQEIDERLLKEIAIYSDKIDISEEMTRFNAHIEQFQSLLSENKEAVGRKMDFLIQEMVREVNTIAAKSSEIAISQNVIEIKSELEKIREQTQNIE